jgi:hypothetical protein
MIRSCFLWCKHVVYAVAVLAIVVCLAEIGLRVYDSATAQVTRCELYDRGLVCKSWFLHHTLKPSRNFGVKNPDTGQRVRIAVNGMGLRGPEPVVPKPAGTFRILCLGDDATFAQGVAESETFCALLQAELGGENSAAAIEVINAGVPDYCPLLSYLQYRHELLSLQADLVILNFDMSDVADDYQVRRYAVMSPEGAPVNCPHPALDMPRGAPRQNRDCSLLLPQFARQKLNVLLAERTLGEKSRSIESPRCRYLWLEDQPPDWTIHVSQALSPLANLADLTRVSGARLVVVACPAPWQVSASASNGEGVRELAGVGQDTAFRSRRPFQTIGEFCQSRQISFCDLSDTFVQASEPDQLYFKNTAALSPDGHALYAHELAEFLRRQLPSASPAGRDYAPLSPQARLPQR